MRFERAQFAAVAGILLAQTVCFAQSKAKPQVIGRPSRSIPSVYAASGRGNSHAHPVLVSAPSAAFGFLGEAPLMAPSEMTTPLARQPRIRKQLTAAQLRMLLESITNVGAFSTLPISMAHRADGGDAHTSGGGADRSNAAANTGGVGFPNELPDAVVVNASVIQNAPSTSTTKPSQVLNVAVRALGPPNNDEVTLLRDPAIGGLQIVHISKN